MSKRATVEMKLRLDPKLKARLQKESRMATVELGRAVSLNEYAVAILLGAVTGRAKEKP
jgi:hypothetical protein